MLHARRSLRIASTGMALALFLTACSSGDDDTEATPTSSDTTDPTEEMTDPTEEMTDGAGGPESPASALRATLTAALQEHVYLAGITIYEGLTNGVDSDAFAASAGALDGNSQALAGAIASVYGPEAGDAFLPLWRNHIGFFVDYTVAKATGDDAGAEEARAGLDTYRADFGAFIGGANPNLPAEAVAAELVPHVDTVFATIDALATGEGDPFALLRDAAAVMPGTAAVLTGGIAAQFPELFTGDAAGPGASLRATLTAGLQEHVYLAGITVVMGVDNGLDSPQFAAAAEALDGNSQDLAAAIASVYGQEAGDAFLPLWRNHIGFFVDYTAAKATGDEAGAEEARAGLDTYRADFGAFIGGANPNLPAEAVAEELIPHVSSVFAAIDAVVSGEGDPFAALAEAAAVMSGTAEILAGGIAAQFPEIFGS